MLDFWGEWHIIKVIKVEANESIGSPKRKDPLPELQSPKGGLLYLVLTVRLSFVQPLSLASLDSSPSRGASGETVHFAGPCRRGYFSNLFREFVENARVKREEFVNVIKMRRRY